MEELLSKSNSDFTNPSKNNESKESTNFSQNSSSSFSSSDTSSSLSYGEEEIEEIDEKKRKIGIGNIDKGRVKIIFFSIICILFNIGLILINVILFFHSVKEKRKMLDNVDIDDDYDDTTTTRMYEMFLYEKNEKVVKTQIVVMGKEEYTYEGDFYVFENEELSGMVYELKTENDEGDVYKFCADECRCFVECKKNDDCTDMMKCNEKYECVDDLKRRKETERRIAHVAIIIPLALCSFGFFTSMYLAEDYSRKYFDEKCKQSCPPTTEVRYDSVEIDLQKQKSEKVYHCSGKCAFDDFDYHNRVGERLDSIFSKYPDFDSIKLEEQLERLGYGKEQVDKNSFVTIMRNDVSTFCESTTIESEETGDSTNDALKSFIPKAEISCKLRNFNWVVKGETVVGLDNFVGLCQFHQKNAVCI